MRGASTFEHAADVGVAGEGATLGEAFAAAAWSMFSLETDLSKVRPAREIRFQVREADVELLFVRFLNELLARADLEGLLLSEFTVTVEPGRLEAAARGEPFDATRHARGIEVKGATLTALRVAKTAGGYRAQTVVDV